MLFNLFFTISIFSANEPYWQSNRSCHPPGCNAPSPCVFVIVSWQSEMPARPGWQLVVLTAALPENGTLPVELQLPPLLLPLRSIACRCCINIPCQGDCNNCEIHAMFQRHVNFSSGTIKEGNTVPGFLQALKSEKGFFTPFFFRRGGCFIRVQKSTRFFYCPFPESSCSVSLCEADLSWPTADMEMGLRFYGPNGLDTVELRGHEYWMLFLVPFYVIHCQYIINRWYHIQNYWTKHYRGVLWKELYVEESVAEKIQFKWY